MKYIATLFTLLLFVPLHASAEGKAKIVTSMSKGAQCIAAVHIKRINGREVQVNRGGFELEPGKYTMSGSMIVDNSTCGTVGRGTNNNKVPPLEAEFEAGKTYWVGFDHKSANRKDWKYVIWNVKD